MDPQNLHPAEKRGKKKTIVISVSTLSSLKLLSHAFLTQKAFQAALHTQTSQNAAFQKEMEGAGLRWRYWEDESGRFVTEVSNWAQNEFI